VLASRRRGVTGSESQVGDIPPSVPRPSDRAGRTRSARGRWPAQQSGGEFSSAVSPTRARDAAVSKYEDAAEIQFSSRPGPQPFQSGAASHHPAGLQAETLDGIGGVARTCRVERRLRTGVSPCAAVNPVTLTTPIAGIGSSRGKGEAAGLTEALFMARLRAGRAGSRRYTRAVPGERSSDATSTSG
jgi:hypothetical protein